MICCSLRPFAGLDELFERAEVFLHHKDALLAHMREFHSELLRYSPRLHEATLVDVAGMLALTLLWMEEYAPRQASRTLTDIRTMLGPHTLRP